VCHNDATSLAGTTCVSCHFELGQHPAPTTAHTASASGTCASCHDKDAATPGIDIGTVHAKLACTTCHANPTRIGDIKTKTAECASCHAYSAADGRDHADFAANHSVAEKTECYNCHVHSVPYSAPTADRFHHTKSCATCHDGTVDLASRSIECVSCHGDGTGQSPYHADFATTHTGTSTLSAQCQQCHAGELGQVHAASTLGCGACHWIKGSPMTGTTCSACHPMHGLSSAKTDCDNPYCHGDRGSWPILSLDAHYTTNAAQHQATAQAGGCSDCHSMDLKAAHSNVANECVGCHSQGGDELLGTWDKTCEDCHQQYHVAAFQQHHPVTVVSTGCGGDDGCHAVEDISTLHASAATTVTIDAVDVRLTACQVCHKNPSVDLSTTSAECADCHTAHGDLGPIHEADSAISASCFNCHPTDVRVTHQKSAKGPCAVCHKNPALAGGASAHTADCDSCHTYVGADGLDHAGFAAKHAVTEDSAGCWRDCHTSHVQASSVASSTIHRIVSPATANCAKCHNGTLDLTGKTASCTTCHGPAPEQYPMHVDYPQRHVASATQSLACTGCHFSDVKDHDTTYGCKLCHVTAARGGRASCGFCHTPHSPVPGPLKVYAIAECANRFCHGINGTKAVASPDAHYTANAAAHVATPTDATCADCHSMDLKTAHATVADPCVTCHTSAKYTALAKPWDKKCESCHVTKHAGAASLHAATTAPSLECAGSGCHAIADVTAVHASAEVTITTEAGDVKLVACQVCHKNPGVTLTTAECASCHAGHGDLGPIHTATAASASCSQAAWCHATDIRTVHAKSPLGECAVCHAEDSRVDIAEQTADCAGCHDPTTYTGSIDGSGHVDYTALHTAEPENDACRTCHPHRNVLVPVYHFYDYDTATGLYDPPTCSVCHDNATRGDLTAGLDSIACGNCHPNHGNDGAGHAAFAVSHVPNDPLSAQCTDCHAPADTSVIHTDGCMTCHDVTVFRCTRCHGHGGFEPVPEPARCDNSVCHGTFYPTQAVPTLDAHYAANLAKHAADVEPVECAKCHKMDLKGEHDKAASGAVTCAQCHARAGFPAPWSKECSACHELKHTGQATAHAATAAGSLGCAGSDCHDVADVTALHTDATKVTDEGTLTGCYVCHSSSDAPPMSVECATCHEGHGDITLKHTGFATANTTCVGAGCHRTRLMPDVHAPFVGAGKAFQSTCAMCHRNPTLDAKLAAKGYDWKTHKPSASCDTCHDYYNGIYGLFHGGSHVAAGTVSNGCLTCHSGSPNDVRTVHGAFADLAKCDTCHNNAAYGGDITWNKANSNCETCHPVDKHKDEHDATNAVGDVSMGANGSDTDHGQGWSTYIECAVCHDTNLVSLHANECASCHAGSNPAGGLGVWNGSCQQGACHPTIHATLEGTGHGGAYWGSSTSCDSCHTGDYADGNVDCGGCHTVRDYQAPTSSSDAIAAYVGPATISLSASDPWPSSGIARIYASIDGAAAVTTSSITVAPPADGLASHTVEFWAVDNAGHEEPTRHTVTFTVTNDAVPPVTTSDAKAAYVGIARIKLTASDADSQSGVKATYYILDGGAPTAGTSITIANPEVTSAHTLEFWSVDYSNNEETHHHVAFTCDNDSVGPVTTAQVSSPIVIDGVPWISFYRVWITLLATDVGDSGVVGSYGLIDGARPIGGPSTGVLHTNSNNDYTFGEGVHTLDYGSVDAAGNTENAQHMSWGVDMTGPTIVSNAVATYTGAAYITASASDALTSVNGATWKHRVTVVGQPQGPQVDGDTISIAPPSSGYVNYHIDFWVSDVLGNQTWYYRDVRVNAGPADTEPPSGSMSVDGGADYTSSTDAVVGSYVSDTGSGLAQMRVDPGTGEFGAWIPFASSHSVQLPAGDGLKTVRAEYKDVAGNTRALSDTITLDTTGPTGTMVVEGDAATTVSLGVTVDSDMSDAGSGVVDMRVDPGTGSFGEWVDYEPAYGITLPDGTGDKSVRVEYRDALGHTTLLVDTIELASASGSVTGRITSSGGSGLVGATVSLGEGLTTSTDSSGAYGFASVGPGSHTLTVLLAGYATKTMVIEVQAGPPMVVDIALPARVPGNLAFGRVFGASRSAAGREPALAGDDDPATSWLSDPAGAANASDWLIVDLGALMPQKRFEIVWDGSRYAKSFAIQVSNDGVSWTQIHSQPAGSGGTYTYTRGSALNVRYARVLCKGTAGTATGYSIAEFRIFSQ